jgi:AcrR family transcriptional regulator
MAIRTVTPAIPTVPAVPPPSQRADARRNREAILNAARDVFCEGGCQCPIEDIAKRAGLGVGTVYRHFPNKDALIDALMEQRFEMLAARAKEALEQDDPWEAFCDLLRFAATNQAEDRGLSEVLSQRPALGHENAVKSGLTKTTEELIRRAQATGQMRKDARVEDVPTILCGLGGVIGAHEESMPRLNWERFLAIMLDGLAAPGHHKLPKPKKTISG